MLQLNETTMSLRRINDIAIVRPHGDLDLAREGLLTKTLHSLLTAQVSKVIVDLAEVNHINYQLLGRLARLVPLFRNLQGDVRFVGMTPYLKNIFIVAAPDIELQSYRTLGEAALSFEDRSEPGQVMN